MKNTIKIVSAFLVVITLLAVLASCAPSMEDVVGTYSGHYTVNGKTLYVVIMLFEDGTYAEAYASYGGKNSTENGDFVIKGNKIELHHSDGTITPYKYSKGTLENNGHKFTKEKE